MDQYQLDSLLKQLQGFENAGDSKATLEDVGSSTVPESALEPGEVEDADQHDIGSETIEHTGSEHARIREPKPEDPGGEKAEQTSAATSMDASALERLLATLVPLSAPSEPSSYEPSDPSSYHDPIPYHAPPYIDEHPPETSDAPNPPPDLRSYTFAQALPVIGRLSEDPAFIDKLQEIKSTQEAFELSTLDERNRAKIDLERQLKRARDTAEASGVSYEVDRITKLLNSTLARFDKEALVKWDALARDQQARLEALGVPCFYVLKRPDAMVQERQRRVMEMLGTLLNDT